MKKVLLSFLLAVFACSFAVQAQQNAHFEVVVDEIDNCGPYTWTMGDSNTYSTDTVVTYQMGDTLRVLTLSIHQTYSNAPVVVENINCFYEWSGKTYTEAGTFVDTLKTVNACDSIVSLTIVNVLNVRYDTLTVQACGAYNWFDSLYVVSTTANHTYHTEGLNCDTLQTLNLTIQNALTTDSIVACGMYQWHDSIYFASTQDTVIVSDTVSNCDSVYVLNLQIASVSKVDSVEHCGDYMWYGRKYTTTGVYDTVALGDTLTAGNIQYTCDTMATLVLSVVAINDTVIDTVCYQKIWQHGSTSDTLNTTAIRDLSITDSISKCVRNYHLDLVVIPVETEGHVNFDTVSQCAAFTYKPFGENSRRYNVRNSIDSNFVKEYRTVAQCFDSIWSAHLVVRSASALPDTTVVACDNFYWDRDSINHTTSGTFKYKIDKNAVGCDSTITLNLTINPSPVINAIIGELTVTPGASTTLSADINQTVSSYKWSYGTQTATTPEITISNITENTDVTLIVKNNKNCYDTSWVTIMPYVSIEDAEASNLSLYPNPAVAMVNVDCAEGINSITIFNTVGQQVIYKNQLGNHTTLDLTTLSKGNYTMRVVLSTGEVIVRKMVVTR